jgi:hypothetical protein
MPKVGGFSFLGDEAKKLLAENFGNLDALISRLME